MTNGHLTPTEKRMLDVLSDGFLHRVEELIACLRDELGNSSNVWPHVTAIRKKLRPIGQDVVSSCRDGINYYMHVRILSKDS